MRVIEDWQQKASAHALGQHAPLRAYAERRVAELPKLTEEQCRLIYETLSGL